MTSSLEIKLITEPDIEEVLAIYTQYVLHTSITFEHTVPSFEEYAQRVNTNTQKYPWLIAKQGTNIVGFAYCSTHRYREAYQWSPESTIYMAPNFQGKGIGKLLYSTLFELLKMQGFVNVFAGVVIPNPKSIALHKSCGFEEIGIFKKIGYKQGTWHDTFWFQLALAEHTQNPIEPVSLNKIYQTEEFINILSKANQSHTI
ncbi:MAG: N-acetyltransferase [Bacteroidetes bacterium B1(2017)]|nr:MAG: N-acetyltransferase [Bacteroidetes bacterium B1(2017)]